MHEAQPRQAEATGFKLLDAIERVGNRLPDPVTLFIMGALLVLFGSELAARAGWSVTNPATGATIAAKSLMTTEGLQWVWLRLVPNFTGFPPLGVVLVAMLGIGVAERSGLLGVLLKGMVLLTPAALLTPAVIFIGINSSLAVDAGHVVLPPLAAAVFARAGRSPLVGMAAVFMGVAGGFSANLLLTGLDPLLQGLTETSARLLDPARAVRVDANYFFMVASTFLVTLTGWGVTKWLVEPRFSAADVAEQIAHARLPGETARSARDERLAPQERRGLIAALLTVVVAGGLVALMILHPSGPLHGTYERLPGRVAPVWPDAMVALLFVLILLPGIAYGLAAGTIRSDREAARMMGEAMAGMGTYIVLAFFAAQFVEWFRESNLGTLIALEGATQLRQLALPHTLMIAVFIAFVATMNLFMGSASAKWALLAPVFVPMFMAIGFAPELTQAAYRVGDSSTNPIAPLNPYVVVVLVFMQRYMPKAGIGSLVALMLPYCVVVLILWTSLLLLWVGFGVPLGPGMEPAFIEAIR